MITEKDIMFDEISEEVFEYLDELRESGVINMYQAHVYIKEDFDVSRKLAIELQTAWMESFQIKDQLYRYEDKR
tara:strand:+ start:661 stop:882 length:222 start_codon:yes stop_codon:yes gene_type:complete